MGVLTELKPFSASAKNNKADGGHIAVPSSPTSAANINNNFQSSHVEYTHHKKHLGNNNIAENSSSTEKSSYEYPTDNFSPTFNTIKMSDEGKIGCPSKISNIPVSPNMGPFGPPIQGGHPQGLPPQPYQPNWNQSGSGPGFVTPYGGYGQPSNFVPTQQFPGDPNFIRNSMSHSAQPGMPPRHPSPHHPNGETPSTAHSRISPSALVGSRFPLVPPGGSSPTMSHNMSNSPHWPHPSSELPPNHIASTRPTVKDNYEELPRSNITSDINQTPVVSTDNVNAYSRSAYLTNSEDHNDDRAGTGNESSNGSHSSPILPSSTTPLCSSSAPLCAGCKLRITDKFVLEVVDAKWHSSCLKCVECGVELENQMACFERDRQFFCKEHYVRMYGQDRPRQCSRCLLDIQPTDLVMKARDCLFHVDCFRCARCDAPLKKGDFYGMFDNMPYCETHYQILTSGHADGPPGIQPTSHSGGTFSSESLNHSPVEGMPLPSTAIGGEHDGFSPQGPIPGGMGYPPYPIHGGPDQPPPPGWYPGPPGEGSYPGAEYPFENNNSNGMMKKRRGRKKRKVDTAFAASMGGYMDPSMAGYPPHPGMDGSQMDHGKSKRARTSFKHHQLRIMRSHFQINQNPDSRELKMLSQKTGLDKKVLQVWFQNSRAKHRRGIAQPGAGGTCEGSVSANPVGIPSQTHHSHSSNDATTGGGHEDPSATSMNTLNGIMSNDETDSDSLMEGLPVQ